MAELKPYAVIVIGIAFCHICVLCISRIHHFADLYEAKLGFKVEILRKTLWGDFYLDSKTKRIKKGAQVKIN